MGWIIAAVLYLEGCAVFWEFMTEWTGMGDRGWALLVVVAWPLFVAAWAVAALANAVRDWWRA